MDYYEGNIRKMRTKLDAEVQYSLPLFDNLEEGVSPDMNAFIGNVIRIEYDGVINCVVTGKRIRKAYGEGMSYDAFRSSPLAVESIIRPELSRAHLGEALRDLEWEVANDVQPHIVYLALTSNVKVGVTRLTQKPTRWIDQGAWKVIVLAETPYRQAAGLIEVALKEHVSDKTNWRRMLKNERDKNFDLLAFKKDIATKIPDDLKQFVTADNEITTINYPVIKYPEKVTSLKLDKKPIIEKKLNGIRGQYLIFEDNTVLNLRAHTGYRIKIGQV